MLGHVEAGRHGPIAAWGAQGTPDLHHVLIAPTALPIHEAPGEPQATHRLHHRAAVLAGDGSQV